MHLYCCSPKKLRQTLSRLLTPLSETKLLKKLFLLAAGARTKAAPEISGVLLKKPKRRRRWR
jgi:hypothetical protein